MPVSWGEGDAGPAGASEGTADPQVTLSSNLPQDLGLPRPLGVLG